MGTTFTLPCGTVVIRLKVRVVCLLCDWRQVTWREFNVGVGNRQRGNLALERDRSLRHRRWHKSSAQETSRSRPRMGFRRHPIASRRTSSSSGRKLRSLAPVRGSVLFARPGRPPSQISVFPKSTAAPCVFLGWGLAFWEDIVIAAGNTNRNGAGLFDARWRPTSSTFGVACPPPVAYVSVPNLYTDLCSFVATRTALPGSHAVSGWQAFGRRCFMPTAEPEVQ